MESYFAALHFADYGQYLLTSRCQKKQFERATYPEASLYLNTHLDCLLNCAHHSKDCWSHLRSLYKDLSFKGRRRLDAVYCWVLHGSTGQTGPLAYLLYYSHVHRCAITRPFSSYWEYSVWSFIRLWSDLLIPMASCQRINPPSPGEERPLQHLWSVCSSCQPSIEDNCLFKILRACDLPSMEPKRRLCFTSGSGCVREGVEVQTKEGLILIWTQLLLKVNVLLGQQNCATSMRGIELVQVVKKGVFRVFLFTLCFIYT